MRDVGLGRFRGMGVSESETYIAVLACTPARTGARRVEVGGDVPATPAASEAVNERGGDGNA